MKLIATIAWRNILRHRGKSLVIGTILFIGSLIMTVGNGVISGMNKGLRENIIRRFTGDIVLVSDKEENDNVFFEFMGKSVEPIHNFPRIKQTLASNPAIEKFLPIGKGMVMLLNEDDGPPGYSFVIGVDMKEYNAVFPNNFELIEGSFLEPGQSGVMAPTGMRKEFYNQSGIWVVPQNCSLVVENLIPEAKEQAGPITIKRDLVCMSYSNDNTSFDIRTPITGIIKYKALNSIWGNYVIMDIESYRQCSGYIASSDKSVSLDAEQRKLLDLEGTALDDIFAGNTIVAADAPALKTVQQPAAQTPVPPVTASLEDGSYTMVLTFLKKGSVPEKAVDELNRFLQDKNLGLHAITWKKATGQLGSSAALIKASLSVFVMMLFFVAIIIIVNTLSMAALERTSEIGMMRAIGARKMFISLMFFGETVLLASVFGGSGIAFGAIVVKILALLHITTDNEMLQLLYGGDIFQPFLQVWDILLAIIQLAAVTLIAVLYPIHVAKSITPLDAVVRD